MLLGLRTVLLVAAPAVDEILLPENGPFSTRDGPGYIKMTKQSHP
jgi:hypothetical protein